MSPVSRMIGIVHFVNEKDGGFLRLFNYILMLINQNSCCRRVKLLDYHKIERFRHWEFEVDFMYRIQIVFIGID